MATSGVVGATAALRGSGCLPARHDERGVWHTQSRSSSFGEDGWTRSSPAAGVSRRREAPSEHAASFGATRVTAHMSRCGVRARRAGGYHPRVRPRRRGLRVDEPNAKAWSHAGRSTETWTHRLVRRSFGSEERGDSTTTRRDEDELGTVLAHGRGCARRISGCTQHTSTRSSNAGCLAAT